MKVPVQTHIQNPRNAGKILKAHGSGKAGSAACGAVIKVYICFRKGNVEAASFEASGTPAVIAAGSIMTEAVKAKSWQHAARYGVAALVDSLISKGAAVHETGQNNTVFKIEESQAAQAAQFAVEALHLALEDSFRKGNFPVVTRTDENTVLVAMSGGVDSSVACLLEKQKGKDIIGVTMRLAGKKYHNGDDIEDGGYSCCSPLAIREARAFCHSLDVPHLTLDFEEQFENIVIKSFISEYLAGRTPNPCVTCNAGLRFPALVEVADHLGAAKVATGHYARLTDNRGEKRLARGRDSKKDQSYMLSALGRALLERLEFPLGEMEKQETRKLAAKARIHALSRPESQDICFIDGKGYRAFLRRHGDFKPANGELVDTGGRRLGTHTGYADYTIGQRRGLRLGADQAMYVLKTEPGANRVVIGGREELMVDRILIGGVNIFVDPAFCTDLEIQVRYNSAALNCKVIRRERDGWLISLNEPAYGVAPGQIAVIYHGDDVVAAGSVETTRP